MPDYCPEICPEEVEAFQKAFHSNPSHLIALNAVTKAGMKAAGLSRKVVNRSNHVYSDVVKTGAATTQNHSGRCWMFAGLNLFRMEAADKMGLEDFEFSQTYQMFWDKIEKSNYFLETILDTLNEPTDGRLISWIVIDPIQDGGQWDMFVNLVNKYGAVPKSVMPETDSSSNSSIMNYNVTTKLREYASILRSGHQNGSPIGELRAKKATMLEEIYRMLCIHLGEPPTEFMWQWRDKDKNFHRDGLMTPQQFAANYIATDLNDLVCLIHCPQKTRSFNTLYTIERLGNVVGGHIIRYLNVDLEIMKEASIGMIKESRPVWFGCDVGKHFDRDLGLMDMEVYDLEGIYGTGVGMDKGTRLDYGGSQMTHAMVFTGVDLDDNGKPTKWRVENSWGDKFGEKGFMIMTDVWFDEYNYEVVVDKKFLTDDLLKVYSNAPIGLPPWDPMGALAAS
ncbi:MAG: C1 family peptidase [Chthonomonadales bacterium]